MSVIDTLITDRTQDDVDTFVKLAKMRWQDMSDAERATFNAGRGDYSADVMNRVGEAVNYLVARVNAAGGRIRDVEGKTDYAVTDYITPTAAREYLNTVIAARGIFAVYPDTPAVPETLAALSYKSANDIERILRDIDELITKSQAMMYYSGDIYAGEVTDEG